MVEQVDTWALVSSQNTCLLTAVSVSLAASSMSGALDKWPPVSWPPGDIPRLQSCGNCTSSGMIARHAAAVAAAEPSDVSLWLVTRLQPVIVSAVRHLV
jgi:hypothetical protein